jgi:hypothetical protein
MDATHTKESAVKRGHCYGTKKERKGASDWYKEIEAEAIRKVEAQQAQAK